MKIDINDLSVYVKSTEEEIFIDGFVINRVTNIITIYIAVMHKRYGFNASFNIDDIELHVRDNK